MYKAPPISIRDKLIFLGPDDMSLAKEEFPNENNKYRYSDSWLYITQACRGAGNGFGLLYRDEQFSVFIGFDHRHWVLVRPRGDITKVFFVVLEALLEDVSYPIYVKKAESKVRHSMWESLLEHKLSVAGSNSYPWDPHFRNDDDTYPECIIEVEQALQIPAMKGKKARRLRQKLKKGRDLFSCLKVAPFEEANISDLDKFLCSHFGADSQYRDAYRPMLEILKSPYANDEFFSIVAFKEKIVKAFFVYERLDSISVGLYASISDRKSQGLSETMYMWLFKHLDKRGIKFINVGGSEEFSLDKFKRKFIPSPNNLSRHFPIFSIHRC